MGTIADKLNKLISTKSKIKYAIVSKGQSISDSDTFDSYANKILAIQTGVDTNDATATADDIVIHKTAYAKGNKITGNISYTDQYTGVALSIIDDPSDSTFFKLAWNLPNKLLFYANSVIGTRIKKSQFGTAIASDVASSKSFTGYAGVKITGTLPQTLANVEYKIDANVIGNIVLDSTYVGYVDCIIPSDRIFRKNSKIVIQIPESKLSMFGDATTSDVASGKIFTGAGGFYASGTASIGSSVEQISVTIRNNSSSALRVRYTNGNSDDFYDISIGKTSTKNDFAINSIAIITPLNGDIKIDSTDSNNVNAAYISSSGYSDMLAFYFYGDNASIIVNNL